ncbi:MAG TPA: hypothetical protein PK595_06790 [Bacteroidota bacterium]|nr:hypothetical protein [Bacteroidota bacterium]
MDRNSIIKLKVQELIHGKGATAYELADMVNKSYSYLCRIANPSEELPTPIEIVLPIMKFKKNYKLLEYMAWECGFTIVRLPRNAQNRKDETEMAANYQKAVSDAMQAVIEFFEVPNQNNYGIVSERLMRAIQESITMKKYCDKKSSNQMELSL